MQTKRLTMVLLLPPIHCLCHTQLVSWRATAKHPPPCGSVIHPSMSFLPYLPSIPSSRIFCPYFSPISSPHTFLPVAKPGRVLMGLQHPPSAPQVWTSKPTSSPSPTKYFWLCHCFLLYLLVFSTHFLCQYPFSVSSPSILS